MNTKALKIIKIAVSVASIGVTFAANYFADKDLDDKVTKKVTEALAKASEKDA